MAIFRYGSVCGGIGRKPPIGSNLLESAQRCARYEIYIRNDIWSQNANRQP